MQQHSVQPNAVTYTAAIGACEQGADAVTLLQEMRKSDVKPNVISYSAAISVCEKENNWHMALGLLTEMKARGVEPNVVTYSAVLGACERTSDGQWQHALKLFGEMFCARLRPNSVTYGVAMNCCLKGDQWQAALTLFSNMVSSGVKPTPNLVKTAVKACELGGQHTLAAEIAAQRKYCETKNKQSERPVDEECELVRVSQRPKHEYVTEKSLSHRVGNSSRPAIASRPEPRTHIDCQTLEHDNARQKSKQFATQQVARTSSADPLWRLRVRPWTMVTSFVILAEVLLWLYKDVFV